MTTDSIPQIIILVILVLFSAYFSATETAFSSLNKTRIKTLVEKGNKRAKLVLKLSDDYDKLLSAILIGNNIVNISMASIATVLFISLYGDIGATISTAVITVVVLIFGEISPKSLAKDSPEKFAMFSAPFISVLIVILTPLNFIFSQWKKLLSKLFKIEESQGISQEELLMIVDEVQQDGNIDDNSGELIRSAIEFRDLKAEEILTHRMDLEAVSIDADKQEIAEKFSQTKFSRLLIYDNSIDNIVGVIHQKDFYIDGAIAPQSVSEIMSAPVFVQQSDKINDILKTLQKEKSHVAVVLDEYCGTLGIVTMEDILEELVGEIWDEHDEVVESFVKTSDNTYTVDCSVTTEEFFEFFELKPDEESISLSGWIMENLGDVPNVNDTFSYEHLDITVLEMDIHRAEKISVRVNEKPEVEEEEE